MGKPGEKLYDVWVYVCEGDGDSGVEGWDCEKVWATDKEAAWRKVNKGWTKYDESKVKLAEVRHG